MMCFVFGGYLAVVVPVDTLPPSLLLEARLIRSGWILRHRGFNAGYLWIDVLCHRFMSVEVVETERSSYRSSLAFSL